MNRSKAPLALMGQLLVVLFFAVAAAICLQAFAKSEIISEQSENRDQASRICQNAAETLKSVYGDLDAAKLVIGGNVSGDSLTVRYNHKWEEDQNGVNQLLVTIVDSGEEGLGTADLAVTDQDGVELFRLSCAWQEGLE